MTYKIRENNLNENKKQRKKINQILDKLSKGLKRNAESVISVSKIANPHITVEGSKIGLDNFRFVFEKESFYNTGGQYMYDNVRDVHEVKSYSLEKVSKDHFLQNLDSILRTARTNFFHELVHSLDKERFSKDFFGAELEPGSEAYFNSPKELNAFYQTGINKVEREIERDSLMSFDPIEDGWDSFKKFKRNFFGHFLGAEWNRNASEENKKRITKRLYQYWRDNILPLTQEESVNEKVVRLKTIIREEVKNFLMMNKVI